MNLCPMRTMIFIAISLVIAITTLLWVVMAGTTKFQYRIAVFMSLVYLAGMVVCWINCFGMP